MIRSINGLKWVFVIGFEDGIECVPGGAALGRRIPGVPGGENRYSGSFMKRGGGIMPEAGTVTYFHGWPRHGLDRFSRPMGRHRPQCGGDR